MRGVLKPVVLGAVVVALGAASAWAAAVHGTAKADVIHGTSRPDVIRGLGGNDKLYGGAGNDKLYGGPGNDLLVGGAGADLLDCGPGHDTAVADAHDTLKGCEVVKALPEAPPTTTTAAPPPPTTTTAPAPQWQAGHYCGFTQNGGSICFDITAGPATFTNATYTVTFDRSDCDPPATGTVDYTTSGAAPLQSDGSFDFNIAKGDEAGTDITGVVDTQGGATGNLHVHSVVSSGGTTYTCTLDAPWSTRKQ